MNTDKNPEQVRRKKTDQNKIHFQHLLVEVVSIILGVTLALAVNEWRENRSHRAQADAALTNIREEISANLKTLEFLHVNNSATLNLMQQSQVPDSAGDRKFIPGIQLRETSWQTMLNTGISTYIPYETILDLSETYSVQSVYKKTASMLTEAAMNMSAYAAAQGLTADNKRFQEEFIDYFGMLVNIEDLLIQSYQKNLELLEKQ